MRNNEQRTAAVKRRAQELRRQRRARRAGLLAAAACLCLIIGLSFAMPGITSGLSYSVTLPAGTAASIFNGSSSLGYIVIGLLAFALGACVTVLCYRLRKMDGEEKDRKAEKENGDGRAD